MTISDTYEVDACIDCVLWHANGDDSGIADEERIHEVHFAVGLPANGVLAVGDGEQFFTWQPCEVCGSRLGGDRITCTVLIHD